MRCRDDYWLADADEVESSNVESARKAFIDLWICYYFRAYIFILLRIMVIGFYSFYKRYNGGRLLEDSQADIGDDLHHGFVTAARMLRALGHTVVTADQVSPEKLDAVFFFDHPGFWNLIYRKLMKLKTPMYLFLFENPMHRPDNYWKWNHVPFKKVFTWNPDLCDGKKYFRFRLPVKIPVGYKTSQHDRKLCCMVASQKYGGHKQQLYSERVKTIEWFERNAPIDDFELWGQDWNIPMWKGNLARLNYILPKSDQSKSCSRFHYQQSWKGPCRSKRDVMQKYKFALCYENASFPGYVTEKVFDAMFAGCIPVYLGDNGQYLPGVIYRSAFKSDQELYAFLKLMGPIQYERRLREIERFINGQSIQKFSGETFARLIINQIENQ